MHYPAPFLCLPLSLLPLAPSRFFFFFFFFSSFPSFVSSSFTEGHKSGFRGKIWRRWELSSWKSDWVEGIFFGGEAASSHLFAFRPPRPPPAQPLCTSGGARSPSIESSGGILLGSGEERGGGPRPRPGSCLDLTPAVGNAGVHFRVGLLQIYILKYQI